MGRRVEPLDDLVADPLVLGVVRGDRAAWFQLTLYIEHWVSNQVPNHWRMRKARLSHSEDDVRDVLLEVLERVGDDDFRPLRQYLDRKMQAVPDVRSAADDAPQVTFASWLSGLVDYAIRDHVRKRYGRAPTPKASEPPDETRDTPEPQAPSLTKRDLHSWAVHPSASSSSAEFGGGNPAVTGVLTAHAILRYAAETFDERELGVFRRYLEQASFEELAQEFELEGKQAAEAEIRRLKERLRARFRAS
jgi:DNA-directed RNA polymerase specialized sigma24 family protein